MVISKHAAFNETSFPHVEHPKKFMDVLKIEPQMEEMVTKKITVPNVSNAAIESKRYLQGSERSSRSTLHNESGVVGNASNGDLPILIEEDNVSLVRRYAQRVRREPMRFTLNALKKVLDEDKPRVCEALESGDKINRTHAMKQDIKALKGMQCWEVLLRPDDAHILLSKFELKRKRDEKGVIKK